MKIGDEVYVHGFVDEIRKDCVIVRNDGGYFGTISSEVLEVVRCKDCKRWDDVPADETQDHECHLFDGNKENIRIATPSDWFCPKGERREE